MSKAIDAYITVRFRANNLIDDETLDEEYSGDLLAWVKELHMAECIVGIVEDDGEIVSVERIEDTP